MIVCGYCDIIKDERSFDNQFTNGYHKAQQKILVAKDVVKSLLTIKDEHLMTGFLKQVDLYLK